MKHRHTFFVSSQPPTSSNAFELVEGENGKESLVRIRNLHAAREWKITLDTRDLDAQKAKELKKGLITVQFVGQTAKDIPEPLYRGFVQGLHVFWRDFTVPELPFVGSILSKLNVEPITMSENLHYLHLSDLPSTTLDALFRTLWSLQSPETDPILLASLARADVIEFDVLSSNTIQIRALWASASHSDGWRMDISAEPHARVEVGIFEEGSGKDKDEHALNGVRAVIGQDEDFEPVDFTFPHRHHIQRSHPLITSLDPPYGSHPKMQTSMPLTALRPPVNDTLDHDSCILHALYTLSKDVFVDKYQLAQLSQFQSGGLKDVKALYGETDLEDPSYMIKGWGSIVLVEIAEEESELTFELPLHLRYLQPQNGGGYQHLELLPPEIFWACQNTVEDFILSPFGPSSKSVMNALFPVDTVFYHLTNHVSRDAYPEKSQGGGVVSLDVPIADASQLQLVQSLTVFGILAGFMYLLVKGIRVGIKGLRWRGKGKEKAKEM